VSGPIRCYALSCVVCFVRRRACSRMPAGIGFAEGAVCAGADVVGGATGALGAALAWALRVGHVFVADPMGRGASPHPARKTVILYAPGVDGVRGGWVPAVGDIGGFRRKGVNEKIRYFPKKSCAIDVMPIIVGT